MQRMYTVYGAIVDRKRRAFVEGAHTVLTDLTKDQTTLTCRF